MPSLVITKRDGQKGGMVRASWESVLSKCFDDDDDDKDLYFYH